MAKIIIEIARGLKHHRDYKIFESSEVHVGRGFDNDIILQDPYVSAQHVVICLDGDKIKIKDLKSKNGIYMPKIKQKVDDLIISSGDELIIGQTHIRVFLDSHEVQPAKILRHKNEFLRLIKKPVFVWGSLFILMGLMLFEAHFNTVENEKLLKLLPSPISAFIIVLLWASFWAFMGRLIKHKIRFSVHVSICCLWFFINFVLNNINEYLGFYANSQFLETVLVYIIQGGTGAVVLYTSLSFSTNMLKKAKLIFSITFSSILILLIVGLIMSISESLNIGGPYSTSLKPPILMKPKAYSIDHFINKSDRIFVFKDKENMKEMRDEN